ncbi:hypothetical protein Caci_7263 [Catenulispora acidiphila DSM 44928]|uniref:Uncharacterized protein n=1 Tax=Catenulispora acidiphila (strain DSM 44928 / JCM 14897 / NBRC 102108 / NRRL B-24433 / ID139908) TaxID=479433 RepID=C7Q8A4_CATAD|nr:hypothetical protein [Catenulispora acidiphila]ACU76092.1 hypothetical protein Caci_7263 [Catenulispora acidiphila DSM 44928]
MAEDKNQNAENPSDAPILSEQEWAEFERSFTKESTKTATFKEPSARQRELSEKWKRQRPHDGGWRADGTPTDLADAPAPVRDKSAPIDYGTGRRRRWRRNVAWVVLAALVTSAIIGVPRLFSSAKGGNDRNPNVPPASGTPDGSGAGTSASASAPASARDALRFSVAGLDYQLVMLAPERSRIA